MGFMELASADSALPCSKYFIFGFNFLTWCLGAALFIVGIIIRTDDALFEYTKALDIDRYYTVTYICMAIGVLILIATFIGCLGAAVESPCLLSFFVLVTVICLSLEITACILVWKTTGGEALQKELTDQLLDHIDKYQEDEASRRFLNLIQYRLECCGARHRMDYDQYDFLDQPSCSSETTNNLNIKSCGENLRRYLERRGTVVGGLSIGLIFLHVFSLAFDVCLIFGLRRWQSQIESV